MELHAKTVRSQLNFFKPFVANCSLEVTRKGQDKLGELMTALHKHEVMVKEHDFGRFQGAWIMPKDERRNGVVLYLHGGGYTCGSLEYAKGFGATLASEAGVRVFCAAYRLAPENRYPAALDDALESYNYLLRKGYSTKQIMLCGESAGGGLIFALCLKLKQLGQALPCGLIGISPWTDLTGSGDSYETNKDVDPSMTQELLQFYAQCYTDDAADPLCSPLFGDLTGLPPSLLFVGGDEIMLDDTRLLYEKLTAAGCKSRMIVAPERWHAYVLYCLSENMPSDFEAINKFMDRVLSPARSLRWMRLDNAAKIYPAAKRRNWVNFFRLSADAFGAGRYSGAARRAGRDGAPLPVDRRAPAAAAYSGTTLSSCPKRRRFRPSAAARWRMRPSARCANARCVCWYTTSATASRSNSSTQ